MVKLSHKKVAGRLAVSLVSVLVLVGLSPVSASAAENDLAWVWWQNPASDYRGGVGTIRSLGENIVLEDFQADGWGTRGQLQVLAYDPAGYRYWKNHGGVCFDDTTTSNAGAGRTSCEREVAEGTTFRLHIWASRSGVYKWHDYSPAIVA